MASIVCLTNTFPYKGEQFLRTELELVDPSIPIELWTFLPPENGSAVLLQRETIGLHVYDEAKTSLLGKVMAAISSVIQLLKNKEFAAALRKKGIIRNLIKSIKFGYISELRVIQISDWVRRVYGDAPRLIFYSYWMYEVAYVAARLKTIFPQSKFVTRCHRFDLYESQHANGYLPYRHFILEMADIVFPISEDAKQYLNALYRNKYDHKMEVARIGSIRDFDSLYTGDNEKILLVSCSNMIPVKRVSLIAEALQKTDLNIEWYHFGDGETRSKVEEIIKKFPKNVCGHLMGYTQNVDIQKFYSSHDITALINTSSSEGVPVSIMEAQSYGIPVIATNVGGTSEIVMDGKNGVLLSVDFSSEELLSAIETVLAHKDSYHTGAINTWSSMSDQQKLVMEFYTRLSSLEEH